MTEVPPEHLAKFTDHQLVKSYRVSLDNQYAVELLKRYQYFLLKVISRWNSINRYHVRLNESDFDDAHQCAKLAVINYMIKVRNPDAIRHVSVAMESYICNALDKNYRPAKYEESFGLEMPDGAVDHLSPNVDRAELTTIVVNNINRYPYAFFGYIHGYTYYKVGLMFVSSIGRLAIELRVHRALSRELSALRMLLRDNLEDYA